MDDLLQALGESLEAQIKDQKERATRLSRFYQCRCGNPVFFDNTRCVACGSELGFLPDEGRLVPLDPGPQPEPAKFGPVQDLIDAPPDASAQLRRSETLRVVTRPAEIATDGLATRSYPFTPAIVRKLHVRAGTPLIR